MITQFSRSEILLGAEAIRKLQNSRVAIFGIGGVGGYIAEALARAGVGALDLVDNDVVSLTNLNRQIIALHSTLNQPKTKVAEQRLYDINPKIQIVCHNCFYLPENSADFNFAEFDYVADAIDTVAGKIALAQQAVRANTPIISAMGAGNKLEPTMLKVADIAKTKVCPLAKVMRSELRQRGINHLKVVYSEEPAITPQESEEKTGKRQTAGSVSFVPSVMGLIMAGEIIKDLINGVH
ncbi:MAG: tRNA threonylcarbamoyladenosine dehydratase [Alphaproteobacteria bacterium]|nr:tRNA threonylcarbamoyladenosine dehydratase [Alphaproteobacteria bacterium]